MCVQIYVRYMCLFGCLYFVLHRHCTMNNTTRHKKNWRERERKHTAQRKRKRKQTEQRPTTRKEAMTFNSILLFKSNHNTRNNIKHTAHTISFVVWVRDGVGIVVKTHITHSRTHHSLASSHSFAHCTASSTYNTAQRTLSNSMKMTESEKSNNNDDEICLLIYCQKWMNTRMKRWLDGWLVAWLTE